MPEVFNVMTRSRSLNFTRGLATGYFLLGVNIFYTAVSVPLGLHFLGREQFGVWALAQQISGYFWLLDLGMSAAVSRLIADKKSEVAGDDYRSLLLTGGVVLILQGLATVLLGGLLATFAPKLFGIPDDLAGSFSMTLLVLSFVAGLSLAQRCLGLPLWAFQRMDAVNFCTAASLLLALGTIWAGLEAGMGIYSLAFAGLPGVVVTALSSYRICKRNGYYPPQGWGGHFSWPHFRSCLDFGRDVFVIGLGTQLVNASQVMVISKFVSLESAAVFAVASKFYYLAQQICSKIIQSSIAGLTEIFVQRDRPLFIKRVLDLFVFVVACACWASCALIVLNSQMIFLWTSGKIFFTRLGDLFLGLLLVPAIITPLAIETFIAMGFLKSIRYLRLAEGVLIFLGSIASARCFGINGVLAVCLAVGLFGLLFSLSRLNRALPGLGLAVGKLLGKVALLLALAAAARLVICSAWIPSSFIFAFSICFLSVTGILIFCLVIPSSLRIEFIRFQKTLLSRQPPMQG